MKIFKLKSLILIIILIFNFTNLSCNKTKTKPSILHCMLIPGCTGSVEVTLSLYKYLLKKQYDTHIVTTTNSYTEKTLKEMNYPFFSIDIWGTNKNSFNKKLYDFLLNICIEKKIDIIHCNKHFEYKIASLVAKKLKIKVIGSYHLSRHDAYKYFKDFDAVITTSPPATTYLNKANKKFNLGINHIKFIPPPFNEERILNFTPMFKTKKEFFKTIFNIDIANTDNVICTIANLMVHKNHKVLLKAICKLVHESHTNIKLILVGKGPKEIELKNIVNELNLKNNVFFLGYSPLVPDILYYSDIKILPSKSEAFGIALLEAALMHKPIIIPKGIGADGTLIKDGITGLTFEQDNANDLASKILILINNKQLCKDISDNAFAIVQKKFRNSISLDSVEETYDQVFKKNLTKSKP